MAAAVFGLGFAVIAIAGTRIHEYVPPALLKTSVMCDGFAEPVLDAFRVDWYSTVWRHAAEPSLYETSQAQGPDSYRLTLIPSFAHSVTVRLDKLPDGGLQLTAKRLSGFGGYDQGEVGETVIRRLTSAEQSTILAALSAPTLLGQPQRGCQLGTDGTEWVLESSVGGRYRYLNHWEPERGGVFRETALAMIHLTRWQVRTSPNGPAL